jgi:hypothetical protein
MRTHNVLHVDLLLPYRETEAYGTPFTRPPPAIDQGEEDNVYGPKLISDLQEEGWRQCGGRSRVWTQTQLR